MSTATTSRPPLTPRFWPGWLAVGLLWLIGKTPQRLGLALSTPLAWLMARLMKGRRRIAERNIERCFPEFSANQRRELVEENFRSLARMVFEVTWSWSASVKKIEKMGSTEGHGICFRHDGSGQGSFDHHSASHMPGNRRTDSCAELPGRQWNIPPAQKPGSGVVPEPEQGQIYARAPSVRRDMRSAIRFLRKGGVLWYAPDQDFGPKQSVFVPFFGIRTATLTATAKLIEMTGCKVVPMFPDVRYRDTEIHGQNCIRRWKISRAVTWWRT